MPTASSKSSTCAQRGSVVAAGGRREAGSEECVVDLRPGKERPRVVATGVRTRRRRRAAEALDAAGLPDIDTADTTR